ncbi:ankyrin repeat-containing NPR4-like isoform X1 [Olea europaea subsp. europaea]|uniref:Ankyrin repeat-containing NPR4-like isoform X1 n=1 Tax=Olea europaea subsp. europaea TaxID=158383 RepID=A0A8S0RBH7_OLEEU|nr:ankyrin repeat-containing NPR4-like isoform X1 [Olea europaea subsp. europaea]
MHNEVEVKVESISFANSEQWPRLLLYQAALRGDWKDAETALRSDDSAGSLKITERGDTPLHMAAATKQTVFVRKLVEYLNEGDLELKNDFGNTAFSFAAVSGVVEIAEVMYEKNNNLPTIRDSDNMSPIEMAAWMGNKEMVEYLYKITPRRDFKAWELMKIIVATINGEMFGMYGNYDFGQDDNVLGKAPPKIAQER